MPDGACDPLINTEAVRNGDLAPLVHRRISMREREPTRIRVVIGTGNEIEPPRTGRLNYEHSECGIRQSAPKHLFTVAGVLPELLLRVTWEVN